MRHARPDYNRIQDPLGLIPEDEPVFLLRGQDYAAPTAVEAWAEKAAELGADPEIISIAREQAEAMRDYQDGPGLGKVPDLADPQAVVEGERPAADVKIGSKALAKILKRAKEEGAHVIEASGLLTALAEQAHTEIGRMMVAKNHATLSYEMIDDRDGTPVYGLVARVFDQKIVIRLGQESEQSSAPVNLTEQTTNDFHKGDLVDTIAGPAEVLHWADVPLEADIASAATQVAVRVLPGWRPRGVDGYMAFAPVELAKYPEAAPIDLNTDIRVLVAGMAAPLVFLVVASKNTPAGRRYTGRINGDPEKDQSDMDVEFRVCKGPGGALWTNAGHGWTMG